MRRLSEFIKWYIYITVSILVVSALFFTILSDEPIPVETLWQILLSGLLTTVITVLLLCGESNRKSIVVMKMILHYILLCAVMIVCGEWFGWIDLDLKGIAMMVGAVAVVYLLSFGAYYIIDLKQASDINQKLKEKYDNEE